MRGPIYGKRGDAESPGQARWHPRGDGNRGVAAGTDLGEAHGALLRFHVASAGVRLRQLQDVVGPVLLGLTLRQVYVPAERRERVWGRDGTGRGSGTLVPPSVPPPRTSPAAR